MRSAFFLRPLQGRARPGQLPQSVGSGAGIEQIKAKTVDFGASDMPLTDDELNKDGLAQFPTVIGGVVPVVNIKGIAPGQIRLTGSMLADIYLGKVGEGTAVNWPAGPGGKGNEGVSAFVQRLDDSIGYVEYAYAKRNKMSHVPMGNREGRFVQPQDKNFKAAAAGADWSRTFYQVLTDEPGKDAWPITGATFIPMHKLQDKPAQATAALEFFDWAYSHGDKMASDLDDVPMPDPVKAAIRQQWLTIRAADGKPVLGM